MDLNLNFEEWAVRFGLAERGEWTIFPGADKNKLAIREVLGRN